MKKVFTISPALFSLTGNQENEPVLYDGKKAARIKMNSDSKDIYIINGHPHTYFGECLFNANRTVLSIRFSLDAAKYFPKIDLPEMMFSGLEPKTYKGKNYTITYICVNN